MGCEFPTFEYFKNKNVYTASVNNLNYKIKLNVDTNKLSVKIWEGKFSLKNSEILKECEYDFIERDYNKIKEQIKAYIDSKSNK